MMKISKNVPHLRQIMTPERLLKLVQHPETLDSISYEELKTLALAYPFAVHLKYLLLQKAKQIQHPDTDKLLTAASAASPDRSFLYHWMNPLALKQKLPSQEEVLELKPLHTIKKDLEKISAVEKSKEEGLSIEAPLPYSNAHSGDFPVDENTAFRTWVSQFKVPPLPPPPSKVKESPDPVQNLVSKSVKENEQVASETLARVLARQGHKEKAIAMYERLILANPEKSAIFAAAIQELQK